MEESEPSIQKWIDDCPEHHTLKKLYLRCHPLELTIAIGTGFRKGNQYKLKWTDCKLKERKITVGKTKKRGGPGSVAIRRVAILNAYWEGMTAMRQKLNPAMAKVLKRLHYPRM